MKKIPIIKYSSDIDNKELYPVSWLSFLKVYISSDSNNELEDNIDTDDPESSYSDMLGSLSSLVRSFWKKDDYTSTLIF